MFILPDKTRQIVYNWAGSFSIVTALFNLRFMWRRGNVSLLIDGRGISHAQTNEATQTAIAATTSKVPTKARTQSKVRCLAQGPSENQNRALYWSYRGCAPALWPLCWWDLGSVP